MYQLFLFSKFELPQRTNFISRDAARMRNMYHVEIVPGFKQELQQPLRGFV